MSGECNYCGGEHGEDACDADRTLVYENGHSAGYANGWNDDNESSPSSMEKRHDQHRTT